MRECSVNLNKPVEGERWLLTMRLTPRLSPVINGRRLNVNRFNGLAVPVNRQNGSPWLDRFITGLKPRC